MNRGVHQHAVSITVALTTVGVIAGVTVGITAALTTVGVIAGTVGITNGITATGGVTRRAKAVGGRGCVGVGVVVTGAAAGVGGVDHLREGDALVLEGKPGDRDHAVGEEGALVHQ